MKPKPLSHKTQNTFRFQSLTERISNINIDVVHRVGISPEIPEERDTFFVECLAKWNELNFTESYGAFKRELGPDVETLNQLLHNKEHIVNCLEVHLQKEGSLALQPLLDLLVALAKDLQFEFYCYYPRFFKIIFSLIRPIRTDNIVASTNDTDVIEWSFTCLSYLFKFLWREMVKDVKKVFKLYLLFLHDTQPDHIRNFAAESFAFLIRKVPDKDSLLDFVFLILKKNPDYAIGIGQLLFEIIKGVKRHFHSCHVTILPIILSKLGLGDSNKTELPWCAVLQSQTQMAQSIANHALREHMTDVWHCFHNLMKSLASRHNSENSCDVIDHLERILKLMKILIVHKNGILLGPIQNHVNLLDILLSVRTSSPSYAKELTNLVAFFILNLTTKLEVSDISCLIGLIFNSEYSQDDVFDFVRFMFSYGMFEKDVLPHLTRYCQNCLNQNSSNIDVVVLLAELVLHFRGMPKTGSELKKWRQYNLNFSNKFLKDVLTKCLNQNNLLSDLPLLSTILTLLPHVKTMNSTKTATKLQTLMSAVKARILEEQMPFIFYQTVLTLLLMSSPEALVNLLDGNSVMEIAILLSNNVFVLRTMDLLLHHAKNNNIEFFDAPSMKTVCSKWQANLMSPHHEVRLITLRLFCSVNCFQTEFENQDIFQVCLSAEKIEASIESYREKLKFLDRLNYELISPHLSNAKLDQIGLQYLIGALHVNLSLLWKPILKLIESYARGMPVKRFWQIFIPHLLETVENVERNQQAPAKEDDDDDDSDDGDKTAPLHLIYLKLSDSSMDKPDYQNHRELLWKGIANFTDLAEVRNREIVPIFFRFLENEYYKSDITIAPSQNIKWKSVEQESIEIEQSDKEEDFEESKKNDAEENEKDDDAEENEKDDDAEENEKDDDAEENEKDDDAEEDKNYNDVMNHKKKKKRQAHIKKSNLKTLCVHLAVISQFHNPKSLHRGDELVTVFRNFLTHRNSDVQKHALDFIFLCKDKSLIPYKENLYNLLSDKTFKNEIVSFNIDVQSQVIQEHHRDSVLPILLRIIYGRMNSNTGKNTGGKRYSKVRRGIVLRFLAGAQESELKMFLELAFQPFLTYTNDDADCMVKKIISAVDPANVFPLKRIQGALNLLGVVISKIGNLMDKHIPWLLKLILCMTATVCQLLERRSEIQPQFVTPLKAMWKSAIERLVQFFELYDKFEFTTQDIEAVFDAAVWPQLLRGHFENVCSPTPLLDLFHTWSSNPRYFSLLAKYHENKETCSPLSQLIKLLVSDKIRPSVVTCGMSILENLLTLKDFDSAEDEMELDVQNSSQRAPALVVKNVSKVDKAAYSTREEPPNYGTLLLLPHVSNIFIRLKISVSKLSRNRKGFPDSKANKALLTILFSISEYIESPQQSTELVNLLFPLLNINKLSEEVKVNILETLAVLLKSAEKPEGYVKKIADLFGLVNDRSSRKTLCEMLEVIAERVPYYKTSSDIVTKLNSWDHQRIDQPHFMMRLDGFDLAVKTIPTLLSQNVEPALLVIFNCCHTIRTTDDMGLRNSASSFLNRMVDAFGTAIPRETENVNYLLHNALLPEIRKGFKNKNEIVRHEFVAIFARVVQNCRHVAKLNGFCRLFNVERKQQEAVDKSDREENLYAESLDIAEIPSADPNYDPYKDFFECIRNVQLHIRARALLRLAANSKILSSMQEESIFQYLMPLATAYLFTDNFIKQSNLVHAAVEFVAGVARILSWDRYETLLRSYITLLQRKTEYPKLAFKLVNAVLNAFHFDLSASKGIESRLKLPPIKESKKRFEEGEELMETDENIAFEDQKKGKPALKKLDFLDADTATRIHQKINGVIIPQLTKLLNKKTQRDSHHKLTQNAKNDEAEEIIKVPIALSIVKLLQNLPKGSLEQHISGLFLKICVFLKSRLESVRSETRKTLEDIMISLGPRFFPFLLQQMHQTMTKGYQIHVMIFTVNSVLQRLKESGQLTGGDLDPCVNVLSKVCHMELFSDVAEEKSVAPIVTKLREAKGIKSYNIYGIMARYISENSLIPLVFPLKKVLSDSHHHEVVDKVSKCLRNIACGLSELEALTPKSLLSFTHGVITKSIPSLNMMENKKNDKSVLPEHLRRPDSYIIPAEPKRTTVAKTSSKTNAHVLVEFGLLLLQSVLKHEKKIKPSEKESCELLDPLVEYLVDWLTSIHIQIVLISLRCLQKLLTSQYELPSLRKHINRLNTSLFVILNKFGGAGSKGENLELVSRCFKVVSILLSNVNYYEIKVDHLRVLLSFVEQDIFDHFRQANAFALLKAILEKKLNDSQLKIVMEKVAELSITSDIEEVRNQCRKAFFQYLTEYPMGKDTKKHILFFVGHLCYEREHSRMSALQMLDRIVSAFTFELLVKHGITIFYPLATCLVNDNSPACRKIAATTIKTFIYRIKSDRDFYFDSVLTMLQDSKVTHRRLAAQLCGLFVEVEKEIFFKQFKEVLPIFVAQLNPANYKNEDDEESTDNERTSDHLLYHILHCIMKLIQIGKTGANKSTLLSSVQWKSDMNLIWDHVVELLVHPYVSVRLISCQLIGLLFSHHSDSIDEIVTASFSPGSSPFYLLENTNRKLLKITKNLITQLQSDLLLTELQEQLSKNLAFIAKIARAQECKIESSGIELNKHDENGPIDLDWLIWKLVREVKFEVHKNRLETTKRSCVFVLLAGVAMMLGSDGLLYSNRKKRMMDLIRKDQEKKILSRFSLLLYPMHREINDETPREDNSLKVLAQSCIDSVKKLVDPSIFGKHYAELQIGKMESRTRKRLVKSLKKVAEGSDKVVILKRKKASPEEVEGESKRRRQENVN